MKPRPTERFLMALTILLAVLALCADMRISVRYGHTTVSALFLK